MIYSRSASILALAAALACAPSAAHAQTGPFVGFGAGASRVAETNGNAARFAPSLHLRAGWSITPQVAVMLEGTLNGIGSPQTDTIGVIDQEINGGTYSNRQLKTGAILASVQFGNPRTLYVRPGVGLAAQAFTAYHPLPADGYEARTSYEPGLAAGVAVGRQVGLIPGLPVSVEGVALYTGGEDSSRPRWSAGVQFVSNIRL